MTGARRSIAVILLAAVLAAGCDAVEDAIDDAAARDDKATTADKPPLTFPSVPPPGSVPESQVTLSDPVRTYCDAIESVAIAFAGGGIQAAQPALDHLTQVAAAIAAVPLTAEDGRAIAECSLRLDEALNPG